MQVIVAKILGLKGRCRCDTGLGRTKPNIINNSAAQAITQRYLKEYNKAIE